METIYLACSTMVLIYLLTMFHQFFFLYGYHISYQLFGNRPTKRENDYFHPYFHFFITFFMINNELL